MYQTEECPTCGRVLVQGNDCATCQRRERAQATRPTSVSGGAAAAETAASHDTAKATDAGVAEATAGSSVGSQAASSSNDANAKTVAIAAMVIDGIMLLIGIIKATVIGFYPDEAIWIFGLIIVGGVIAALGGKVNAKLSR